MYWKDNMDKMSLKSPLEFYTSKCKKNFTSKCRQYLINLFFLVKALILLLASYWYDCPVCFIFKKNNPLTYKGRS